MTKRTQRRGTLSIWGLSLVLAVSFLCAFFVRTRVYADQALPALSDRKFNDALSEMVDEYEKSGITQAAAGRNPYITERLILKSTDSTIDPDDYGAVDGIRDRSGMYILQFDSSSDAEHAAALLEEEEGTVYVQPDRCVFLQEDVYTDLYDISDEKRREIHARMSSSIDAIGANVLGNSLKNISGSVTVAVLDTGVDFNAEELLDRIDTEHAKSFDSSCNVDVSKDSMWSCRYSASGHGTHVSGTIAVCTEQVADKVKILPVRVLNNMGSGYTSSVIQGIRYAANCGAKVINMSLGGDADDDYAMKDAVDYAMSKGSVVVVAAGNESDSTLNYEPSNIEECVVVGAVDHECRNDIAWFSNYGQTLDVVAPGVSIFSNCYCCSYNYSTGKWSVYIYSTMSGTSMAAPHASGAAALIRLKYPFASPEQVEGILHLCSTDLGPAGWDQNYGCGIIDLTTVAADDGTLISRVNQYVAARNQAAADKVQGLIRDIGAVAYSESTRKKISSARKAYNALTPSQKSLVVNIGVLSTAETRYAELKKDYDAADSVKSKITAIGTVTYSDPCKAKIDTARAAYNALTSTQKALVTNAGTLTLAEAKYKELKEAARKAAEQKAVEQQAAAQQEADRQAAEQAERAARYQDSKPHANVDYVIPLQTGQTSDSMKVLGLGVNDSVVSWVSSDESIVTVQGNADGTCRVKAGKKAGDAVISATTSSQIMVTFLVCVQKKKVKLKGVSVQEKQITLKIGQTYNLQALPYPVTAGGKLRYSSSKRSVAVVSGSGVVRAKKEGNTVITIKCGKKKIKVKIRVVRP